MKINDKRKRYELKTLKDGECFKDEYGEIYIKTDEYDEDDEDMILCVSLEDGGTTYLCSNEKVKYLPNVSLTIED